MNSDTNVITPNIEPSGSITIEEQDQVVEKIVVEWNKHVDLVQNQTIKLCLLIKEMTHDLPKESVKNILNEVKQHPNIKRFVSIDRIWQGMRLISRRPELIDYVEMNEEKKKELSVQQTPYIKKDGEVFWEYYFELEKHNITPLDRDIIEKTGKEEGWTCKQLREQIQQKRDQMASTGDTYIKNQIKNEKVFKCIAIIKSLSYEKIIDAEKLLIALNRQNLNEVQ